MIPTRMIVLILKCVENAMMSLTKCGLIKMKIKRQLKCFFLGHDRKKAFYNKYKLDTINASLGIDTVHEKDEPIIICGRCKKMLGFA